MQYFCENNKKESLNLGLLILNLFVNFGMDLASHNSSEQEWIWNLNLSTYNLNLLMSSFQRILMHMIEFLMTIIYIY